MISTCLADRSQQEAKGDRGARDRPGRQGRGRQGGRLPAARSPRRSTRGSLRPGEDHGGGAKQLALAKSKTVDGAGSRPFLTKRGERDRPMTPSSWAPPTCACRTSTPTCASSVLKGRQGRWPTSFSTTSWLRPRASSATGTSSTARTAKTTPTATSRTAERVRRLGNQREAIAQIYAAASTSRC